MLASLSKTSKINKLHLIKNNLKDNDLTLTLEGEFQLTKTEKAYCNSVLLRDFDVEKNVHALVENKVGWNQILDRYRTLCNDPDKISRPDHYPMRILSGVGSMASGKNIFLFFPQSLGMPEENVATHFGIEFVDIWENIFNTIVFPCSRILFDKDTQLNSALGLSTKLKETIYLASLFHELGHRIGCYQVSPNKDPQLKISNHYLDILGELATDSLLVSQLNEFTEISIFVILQRIFWFPRRGFIDNSVSGWINQDNDSWLGAYLWNELYRRRILTQHEQKWNLDFSKLPDFFHALYEEIELLGLNILSLPSQEEQDELALNWMKSKVDYLPETGFVFGQQQRQFYFKCLRIPEIPQFNPLMDLE